MFISTLDVFAFGIFVILWSGYSLIADGPHMAKRSLHYMTGQLRTLWMRRLCERDVRVTDSALIGNLMRSVAFFASTSILILTGLLALIGSGENGYRIVQTLPMHDLGSIEQFEMRLALLASVFVYAFFQITWSLRQFNYCCVVIGAAPVPGDSRVDFEGFITHAAQLQALAAESFNRGLRGYYFALAMLAWFVSPWLFIATTLAVVLVMYYRDFRSDSHKSLAAVIAAMGGQEPS